MRRQLALESIVSASSFAMTPGAFLASRASLRPTGLEMSPSSGSGAEQLDLHELVAFRLGGREKASLTSASNSLNFKGCPAS